MASSLPTDSALTKAVDTFGYGPYDGQRDDEAHGEDDEAREPAGSSLPSEPTEGFDFEFWLSYPQETALGPKHASIDWFFSSLLPGDGDRPSPGPRPADSTIDSLAGPPSDVRLSDPPGARVSESALPSDSDNPAARSDYYDRMTMGSRQARLLTRSDVGSDITEDEAVAELVRGMREAERIFAMDEGRYWPSEDSGSYVTSEKKDAGGDLEEVDESGVAYKDEDGHYVDQEGNIESYPQPEFNDVLFDDTLGALGNSDSGYVVEDMSNPRGFPSEEFLEEADFVDENPGLPEVWHLQPFGYASSLTAAGKTAMTTRTATDVEKVRSLTSAFLKEHGKKNIVRRSVLAFLQDQGLPQYLASDIIRCMKHDHDILIPDVMDTFPVAKEAPEDLRRIAALHGRLVEASMSARSPRAASELCRAAARVASTAALLERSLRRPGNI